MEGGGWWYYISPVCPYVPAEKQVPVAVTSTHKQGSQSGGITHYEAGTVPDAQTSSVKRHTSQPISPPGCY